MSVDWNWTGETVAWIVLGISTFYLADRLVVRRNPGNEVAITTAVQRRVAAASGRK